MTKKLVVISSLILATIILIFISYLIKEDNKVASTISLDINPSIKIELNKHDKVLNISALNTDAKKIVNQTKGNRSLTDTINALVTNLAKSKFITEDNVTILVNSTGSINIDQVNQLIISAFRKEKIIANIIIQNSSNTSSKNAKKYNISEGKAAYIETMIKENENLSFETLKDKTINELVSIRNSISDDNKNQTEEKEEDNNQAKEEPVVSIEPVIPKQNTTKQPIAQKNNQSAEQTKTESKVEPETKPQTQTETQQEQSKQEEQNTTTESTETKTETKEETKTETKEEEVKEEVPVQEEPNTEQENKNVVSGE